MVRERLDDMEEDMRDFALDDAGDILLEADDIALCEGTAQEIQKIRQVLGTKLGEWKYDAQEGMDLDVFLQRTPEERRIREALRSGLHEINESYVLQSCTYAAEERRLYLTVQAENQQATELYLEV